LRINQDILILHQKFFHPVLLFGRKELEQPLVQLQLHLPLFNLLEKEILKGVEELANDFPAETGIL
jgi:hypothetical protein